MEIFDRENLDYEVNGVDLFHIVNFNEVMVLQAMREIYEANPEYCDCAICVEDAFALALNSLPPRYMQCTSLESYRQSDRYIDETQVQAAVREAMKKINKNPRHWFIRD